MDPLEFWEPWEKEVSSYQEAQDVIYGIFEKWSRKGRDFAWRGQKNASWPLYSSLYRRLLWSKGKAGDAPQERDLAEAERRILVELHRWGLHMAEYGRLSVLSQLAVLQHYGAPTRLIDITFNPWIGLWFAVEERWSNGKKGEDQDVRLFAIDVTDRLINENDKCRRWEDSLGRPWPSPVGAGGDQDAKAAYVDWTTSVQAWKPPHFHPRIAAQNGGFLLGGVPGSGGMRWPKSSSNAEGYWRIDEVRRVTSVALRVHNLDAAGRGLKSGCVYTLRIKKEAVPEIRKRLQSLFGYQHSTIYPDYTGFAQFGTQYLVDRPAK